MSKCSFKENDDDTAANWVRFACLDQLRNERWIPNLYEKGDWGEFGDISTRCPAHSTICGLRIKFESYQGSGSDDDDTALNDVKFYCCPN